jgi:hypothetical protein
MREAQFTSTYPATSRYALLTGAGGLAALLCAWSLTRQFDWITLIFLCGCLFAAFSFAVQWRSMVELDPKGFWLRSPLRTQRVEFRQLDGAVEAGRMARGIVVTYHPLHANGLLDLDDLHSVTLPAVEQHAELLALLVAKSSHSL